MAALEEKREVGADCEEVKQREDIKDKNMKLIPMLLILM